MAKKRKLKTKFIVIGVIASFFFLYFLAFTFMTKKEEKSKDDKMHQTREEVDSRKLLIQLNEKSEAYISDKILENVKIEPENWSKIKLVSKTFKEIRKPETYSPKYYGYTDSGIRFSTDLNYFRVFTVNREEFYKIPVNADINFNDLIKGSVYASFDSIKKYKTWDTVIVKYKDETKKLFGWNFSDLAYKLSAKRQVGEIQPQKSKERSKYNFDIEIHGEGYNISVEVMGKEYIKIKHDNVQAYYEVSTGLYEYIKDRIFKITENESENK